MNVIFLDIDGVLNSSNYTKRYKEIQTKKERTYKNIDDSALNYLQKLQNKYNAKIVLISTWRKWGKSISIDIKENPITEEERTEDYANLRTLYEKLRIEYDLDLDDMTDDLQNRMLEIQLYLLLHKEIEKFVILDDYDENFTEMFEEQFIQNIQNYLKENKVKDEERNWLPHITFLILIHIVKSLEYKDYIN